MIISWIIAIGILLGMTDMLIGNRFGLGEKFHQGFELIGSMMLSMAGIMALAPAIAEFLKPCILPVFRTAGIDPGMMGILLCNDMGGYQLAKELAQDSQIGSYAGLVVSSVFGCTLVFTVPVGMGIIPKGDRPFFARGIMLGLCAMPAGLLAGGLLAGLGLWMLWRAYRCGREARLYREEAGLGG